MAEPPGAIGPGKVQVTVPPAPLGSVPVSTAVPFVALPTVKTYQARLYEKLSARNRAQALMSAVRLGMFEDYRMATEDDAAVAVS